MSEEDYQRGLRGGPERVSISDWERWKDWKAGHDEYERMQEEEDEARFAEVSTPEETRARLLERNDAREKANEEKLARMYEDERRYQENERRRKEASNSWRSAGREAGASRAQWTRAASDESRSVALNKNLA